LRLSGRRRPAGRAIVVRTRPALALHRYLRRRVAARGTRGAGAEADVIGQRRWLRRLEQIGQDRDRQAGGAEHGAEAPDVAPANARSVHRRSTSPGRAPMPPAIVIRRLATYTSEYELVLMLDPETPDERRDQIATEARGRIETGGSLKAEKTWGLRKLSYEIGKRNEADYRFFRFETESPLLDELNHNLKITDGVLRFRIFKVDPDSPVIEPPPPAPLASAAPRGPGGRRGPGRGRDDYEDRDAAPAPPAPAAPAPVAAAAPAADPEPAPAEPAPAAPAPAAAEQPPAPAPPAAAPEAPAE
jgi:ribosomal protein S6